MPSIYALPALRWWSLLQAGWVTGWLMGAARNSALLMQQPPYRLRTPLLTLRVSALRLNPSAGRRKPYVMQAARLRLVRPSSEAK